MKHTLRKMFLLFIQDTMLENFARRTYAILSQNKGAKYDKETSKVMRKALSEDSNCIDVGAYRGEILREMLTIAPKGKMFAFEPVPENYRYISRKYGYATIHNMALSDKVGEAVFYHVIGRPARSGLRKQSYPNPNEQVEEIKVKVDILDNVIPNDMRIDFIKIDVEGAELLVLRGGEQLIKKNKPIIIFEHGASSASKFETTPDQIYDFLSNLCELKVSSMERWLREEDRYSREEFLDTVYSQKEFCFIGY